MATAKITKRLVDATAPGSAEIFLWDTELKGFGLRVSPGGRKVFVCQYRLGGRGSKSRRETVGPFGPLTVEMAREKARVLLARVTDGVDPIAEEARARAAEAAANAAAEAEEARRTALRLDTLARRFMAEHVALKRKGTTEAFYRHVLDAHILPTLGDRDAREITRQDVAALHAALADRATMANRVIAVLGALYGWAERMEILPEGTRNPTAKLEKFKERARDRFLTVDELARVGEAIRTAETVGIAWEPDPEKQSKHAPSPENRRVKIAPEAAAALRLLLFTGARLREVLHLEWSSVDVDRGLLRLRDSKTGPKTIVLNSPARAVLARLPRLGRYVIPGEIATAVDGTRIEKPRADLKRPWALVQRAAGLSGVRIHDLRHSFASVGAGDGHGLAVVGKLLGHTQTRTTERYAHLDADPLRRASDAIAERIAAAMGEAPAPKSAEVVPLAPKRGAAG